MTLPPRLGILVKVEVSSPCLLDGEIPGRLARLESQMSEYNVVSAAVADSPGTTTPGVSTA